MEAPPAPDALEAGIAHHRAGRLDAAVACYAQVVGEQPNCGPAWRLLGVAALAAGDGRAARGLLERALRIDPADVHASFHAGVACALLGDDAAAIAAYEATVVRAPRFARAHSNLGNLYARHGERAAARRAYEAAVAVDPAFAAAYCNIAALLIDEERYDEAIAALARALALDPCLVEAHANLGQAYRRSGRGVEAIAASTRALELDPRRRDPYLNIALAAFELGEHEAALAANRQALALDPNCAEALCNSAAISYAQGRLDVAADAAWAAIALRPDYAEAHVNLAAALLARGDLRAGFHEYAWIARHPALRAARDADPGLPRWNGEPLNGERLLLVHDQGFGDAIQMVRYLPAVKARGATVVLEIGAALHPLFAGLAGVDELQVAAATGEPRAPAQLTAALMDLPRIMDTELATIPAPIPYLSVASDRSTRWRPRLQRPGLRVGISWAGSPRLTGDRARSCRPDDFGVLARVDGVAWFALQKGADEARTACGALAVEPLGPHIVDFADTAAIVAELDLVISVDTALVHLAGALGARVWTLLPFAADWRWLRGRTETPWYPSMRLFRQPRPGDWAAAFEDVAAALQLLVSNATAPDS